MKVKYFACHRTGLDFEEDVELFRWSWEIKMDRSNGYYWTSQDGHYLGRLNNKLAVVPLDRGRDGRVKTCRCFVCPLFEGKKCQGREYNIKTKPVFLFAEEQRED